jgi:hypothetical protein
MKIYSYSKARQQFATMLNEARRDGQVQIRRRDGQVFVVSPAKPTHSPLEVPGVSARLTREDIVRLVRQSRRSTERFMGRTASTTRLQPARARHRSKSQRPTKSRSRG